MRYADGPTVEVTRHITAPAGDVWLLVSDINLPARFSSEFTGAEWVGGAHAAVLGACFEGHNHHDAIGTWTTTSTVVECEPGRTFAWAVGDAEDPSAMWRFDLEPDADGTNVTFAARIGPGPSGLTPAIEAMPDKEERIIERRLAEFRRNMEATLDGIAELAGRG
ncbi:MAG TPA: SRPBCC family protein [Ilumatobacteraceae bacterium]|nr:SRPBCC family protein [Ilumatobacteraceae bacterium]